MARIKLSDADYRGILEFRTGLRKFLDWSGKQAIDAGITPTQHQLLLAIRGTNEPSGLTVGRIADLLVLRHHSAVELIDRAVENGLVERVRDADDRRLVRVTLTRKGEKTLEQITRANLDELAGLAPRLTRLLEKTRQ